MHEESHEYSLRELRSQSRRARSFRKREGLGVWETPEGARPKTPFLLLL